jgi:hypothetical protein
MFGRTIGSLNVYTRETIRGQMKKIWSKSGNVGDFFERVDLTINENKPFQVNSIRKKLTFLFYQKWEKIDIAFMLHKVGVQHDTKGDKSRSYCVLLCIRFVIICVVYTDVLLCY